MAKLIVSKSGISRSIIYTCSNCDNFFSKNQYDSISGIDYCPKCGEKIEEVVPDDNLNDEIQKIKNRLDTLHNILDDIDTTIHNLESKYTSDNEKEYTHSYIDDIKDVYKSIYDDINYFDKRLKNYNCSDD